MNILKKIALKIPVIKSMHDDVQVYKKGYPPGHFYSPIVSIAEVEKNQEKIFSFSSKVSGISLNEEKQKELLNELQKNYTDIPYFDPNRIGLRYYFNNNTFEYSDAIFLHLLIRHYAPKRIIEIGSGFSSAVMLDTNEIFFDNDIKLTFIEPYPDRLKKLLKPNELELINLLSQNLQDVPIDIFKQLEAGDILFVDSTHVSKTGSDVNTILFDILPILPQGVIIHFHDIFYPFEYPKEWVLGWSGFGWNEIYMVRAFLTNNEAYEILLFNTMMEEIYKDWFTEKMPLCLANKGGSLWLKKIK
ncbi:MAG: class I SAM-dependent methyltransferase [Bacteroidetes bacterium]|nr:class I SAM-dependent methyltransferase [Bacteroidota bacterium]